MILRRGMSIKPFLSNVNECVSTRESKEHVEGPSGKVKLQLYKSFGKEVDFKTYLHGATCIVMLELDSCLNLGQEHTV